MVSKVTFAIFMVLLFTTQGHKLNDEFDELLEKLQKLCDNAVSEAQKVLDDAQKSLVKFANTTQESAESNMEATQANFTSQLNDIKEEADDASVDIDDCLEDDETNLNHIYTHFKADLNKCINNTVNSGLAYDQKSLNEIDDLVAEITSIRKELADCGTGLMAEMCRAELGAKITLEITTLPVKITANSIAAAEKISDMQTDVDNCSTEKTSKWTKKGKALLKTMRECVDEKIDN